MDRGQSPAADEPLSCTSGAVQHSPSVIEYLDEKGSISAALYLSERLIVTFRASASRHTRDALPHCSIKLDGACDVPSAPPSPNHGFDETEREIAPRPAGASAHRA